MLRKKSLFCLGLNEKPNKVSRNSTASVRLFI